VPTLAALAMTFSGAFRHPESGETYRAVQDVPGCPREELLQEVRLYRLAPGVYLVRAKTTRRALCYFLSRRRGERARSARPAHLPALQQAERG
jgi:hypothetical protein